MIMVKVVMNRGQREDLVRLLKENETTIGGPPGHVCVTFNAFAVAVGAKEIKT